MHTKLKFKSVSDRYKRIQEQLRKDGNANCRISDAVGDVCEMLMGMRQKKNEFDSY